MSKRDSSVAWHRELIVNSIRYAAASSDEQQAVVPQQFQDRLGLLQETLLNSWEHAELFAKTVCPVLAEAEHTRVASFVNEVQKMGDPLTSEIADKELDRLRLLAIEIRDSLHWEGNLSTKVFPLP